nr:MAG TPA: hypothetical protein [Caudoviricetes sp.]
MEDITFITLIRGRIMVGAYVPNHNLTTKIWYCF